MGRPTFDEVVRFHGHSCPGLAIGYRMTVAALSALGVERAGDEELVAIVENDACGVDAVQFVAGCSFGKGNLIFRDYGKPVYTFYSRTTGRGVRVLGHRSAMPAELRDDREGRIRWILTAPEEDVVSWREVAIDEPPRARLHSSKRCDACGEPVMETRLREVNGRLLCIPCAEEQESAPCTGRNRALRDE
jgi:formylmethanofuran dehydrogenase subunit E